MDKDQQAVRWFIIEHLLWLPPEKRAEVFSSVRFNEIFCCACGVGSQEQPNPNCQCENDE